ncbi:hypothetical protein [Aureimonas leprariae]|uniref:Uncharacterized protein n=1 Tax=Plantimonas leprariae TaxID=2615207 RepID=A0A7V7PQB1_9HYPH|nr:hypothetical protein [Aureimonas leprariae]KAB0680306.1 hypothetical protein F6X38_09005 [Aureimonas leprariae]
MEKASQIVIATKIPCMRYEGGEDERLCVVLAYALGLIGTRHIVTEASRSIAKIYTYRGELVVATNQPLPASWRMAFERAWEEVGYEPADSVSFVNVDASEWDGFWRHRSFDGDARPRP